MSKKQMVILVILFVLVGLFASMAVFGRVPSDRPHFAHAKLAVVRADGKFFPFNVEVAQGDAQEAYGLMFVRSMPNGTGMIFPFAPPHPVSFWMKNTYIPLDMLFVRPDHRIGRIVANARPFDLTPILSQVDVSAVIEINGGEAAKDGLAVGDRVDSSVLP